jgi:hypothetical protein
VSEEQRATERGVAGAAMTAARVTSRSFWEWFETHHVDSLAVLIVTLTLTVHIALWALEFPYDIETKLNGTDKAAILAAVLTPWGLMQAALFKFYVDLKGKSGGMLS